MNVGLVTLGCSKNQVDSEMLLGYFKNKGFRIVTNLEEAEIIVVNTCGFIESAKIEAINTLLDMADYKDKNVGRCKVLIATGCLAKRYKKEILKNLPEVDLCIGVDEYKDIDKIVFDYLDNLLKKSNIDSSYDFLNINSNCKLTFNDRIISTNFPSCYIRIADGCNNRCSYCAIPLIRGNFKSREMEDILSEVESLASQGIKEFNIIAQDTSKYGIDIYNELKLKELIHKMSEIEGVKWIRILYMYLFEATDELIDDIATNDKVCKYFDIPIQHLSNDILKKMNRYDTYEIITDRINKIREKIPNAILRTTVMTGFPTESEEDFEILLKGIKDIKFDRLGAFAYSREDDTKAAIMTGQIDEKVKQKRLKRVFDTQQEISKELNKNRVGNKYEVIVEEITADEEYFSCRSYMEAPDVDGRIYVKIDEESSNKLVVGDFAYVKIIDYNDYDLYAVAL